MRHWIPPIALLFAVACSSEDTVQPGSDAAASADGAQDASSGDDAGTALCTLDTALSGGLFDSHIVVDSAGTHLYVATTPNPNDGKIHRFKIGKGCALTLDTSFGTGGVLANDWPGGGFGMATDQNLALYRRASDTINIGIGRLWPLPAVECAPVVGDAAFVVTEDGSKGYSNDGVQDDKSLVELTFGATCTATKTGTALGITVVDAMGFAPDGKLLLSTWRSTAGAAGPAGRPIVIYDPVAKAITGEFGGDDFSSSPRSLHACGADVCVYDSGFHKFSRYDAAHAVKATLDVHTVVPSSAQDIAAAITSNGVAYVLYSDGSSLGIARTPIP